MEEVKPVVLNTIKEFELWLGKKKTGNDFPYEVKLNVNNISGTPIVIGSLGNLVCINPSKDVYLDLSGSTFLNNQIEQEAFALCSGLRGITIPISVNEIGQDAFTNSGLEEITFLRSDISINSTAFGGGLAGLYQSPNNGGIGTYKYGFDSTGALKWTKQ
jgi:hypothetical protein